MGTNVDKTYILTSGGTTIVKGCFAVLHTTAGEVTNPGGANAGKTAGVLIDVNLAASAIGKFRKFGYAYCCAYDGNIAIGDDLVIGDTAGRVASKGSGAHTSGTDIVARAEEASSAQGDMILCFVNLTQFTS